jgi:hypothetical protein
VGAARRGDINAKRDPDACEGETAMSAEKGKRRIVTPGGFVNPFAPDFDRHPLNEIEAALEPLETSWVDFLYGVRLHNRYIRAKRRSGMRGFGLGSVHQILDHCRQRFFGGDRIAIWTALIYCIQENVPLPYWLGDEILDIEKKVNREPSSLHELFGLEPLIPAQGKRAATTRRDVQLRGRLWHAASELMAKSKMREESAIKQARKELNFPYGQRKSREMFDEQERIQRGYLDAMKGLRKIRMK